MHLEGLAQRKGHVYALGMLEAVFQEVGEGLLEIRVGAILDDEPGTLFRSEPPQVCEALLRHKNLGVVFCLVYMTHVRHDARNGTTLGHRRRQEESKRTVPCKVCCTADAVHHRRPANQGAVHVPEDVGFKSGVHGDNADTADHVGAVAHLLLTDDKMLFPFRCVTNKFILCALGEGEGRSRGHA